MGHNEDLADLDAQLLPGGRLSLKYARGVNNRKGTSTRVTMPELVTINASDADKGIVPGMSNTYSQLAFNFSCSSNRTYNSSAAPSITVSLTGATKLELNGLTQNFTANLENGSELKAYSMGAVAVDITSGGASKAYVSASGQLSANAGGASTIYYKGNPATVNTTTSGTGRIFKM